jgi:hypothetical protein
MRKASFHIQYGRIVNEDGEGEVSKGQHEQCAKNLLWRLAVVVGLAGGAMGGGGRTKSPCAFPTIGRLRSSSAPSLLSSLMISINSREE